MRNGAVSASSKCKGVRRQGAVVVISALSQCAPCIAVVDGISSGALLAPEIAECGYDPVHVQSSAEWNTPNTSSFNPDDYSSCFIHYGDPYSVSPDDRSVIELSLQLEKISPLAVMAGSESGVVLADLLSERLGLRSNGSALSRARRNKSLMADVIAHARGIESAKYTRARSVADVLKWIRTASPLMPVFLKPQTGGGTRGVIACHDISAIVDAFESIFGRQNSYGIEDDAVFCQECIEGTEYALNTVSADGHHLVTGIWEYGRHEVGGGATVYDWDRLMPFSGDIQQELVAYGLSVLEAMGVRYGPSHIEIKMTGAGPRLVEIGARLYGSNLPALESAAVNRNAVRLAVESFTNPDALMGLEQGYDLLRHAMVVTLNADRPGLVMSYEAIPDVKKLTGYHHSWFRDERKPLEISTDADGEIGEVWLLHESPEKIDESMRRIREWESIGRFTRSVKP